VAQDGKDVSVAEVVSGRRALRVQRPGHVVAATFTRSGRLLVLESACEHPSGPHPKLDLWDVFGERRVRRLAVPGHALAAATFSPDGRWLVTAMPDETPLVWDTSPLGVPGGKAARALKAGEMNRLWDELAGWDRERAYRAARALADNPGESVPFLGRRLGPAVGLSAGKVRGLVRDLDDDDFAVREAAERELKGLKERAVPALRRLLASRPSLEARRRAERLLRLEEKRRLKWSRSDEELRQVRAVELLEWVGTGAARRLLKSWAGGAEGATLTEEAKAALRRLEGRPGTKR
jgi:hypothetical protein